MTRKAVFAATLLFAVGVTPALAQEETGQEAADRALTFYKNEAADDSVFEFSYASPGSPALPLVGVEGDQIARVDSLRKFSIGLINGFSGSSGKPGIAIDFAPFYAFSSRKLSLGDYRSQLGPAERIAARSKIGAAASFGDKATGRPSSLVLSMSSKLLDAQDGLFDTTFSKCVADGKLASFFETSFSRIRDESREIPIGERLEFREKRFDELLAENKAVLDKEYADCATRLAKSLAVKPSWDAGMGVRLTGAPGRLGHLEAGGTVFWTTLASGVIGARAPDPEAGPIARLRLRAVVHARYTLNETQFDDKFVLQGKKNAAMLVAGLESAPWDDPEKVEHFRWNIQAGWNRQNAVKPTDEDKNYWRYLGVASFRVANGIWLNGTLGRVSGKGVKSDTTALLGFTFSPPTTPSTVSEYYNSRK